MISEKKYLWKQFISWVNDNEDNPKELPLIDERDMFYSKSNFSEKALKERYYSRVMEKKKGVFERGYKTVCIIFSVIILGIMLILVNDLPLFGDFSDPVNNLVSEKYIEDGLIETGDVNIVSGMILDYRAFDTFGESTVLFVAATSVMILLRDDRKNKITNKKDNSYNKITKNLIQSCKWWPA